MMNNLKHILILAPPLTSLLDVTGLLEVFAKAASFLDFTNQASESYQLHVVSTEAAKIVNTSAGLPIVCEGNLKSVNYEIDTLLVAGMPNVPENMVNKGTLKWLETHSPSIRRVGVSLYRRIHFS